VIESSNPATRISASLTGRVTFTPCGTSRGRRASANLSAFWPLPSPGISKGIPPPAAFLGLREAMPNSASLMLERIPAIASPSATGLSPFLLGSTLSSTAAILGGRIFLGLAG